MGLWIMKEWSSFVQKLKITKVDTNSGMPFSRASRENGNRFKISNAWLRGGNLVLGIEKFTKSKIKIYKYMNRYSILHLGVVYHTFDLFFFINFKGPSFMDM